MRTLYGAAIICGCLFLSRIAFVGGDSPREQRPSLPAPFSTPRLIQRATPSSTASRRTIRIVSWNIDHGKQLATIEAELAREPGDVYLLQEVDWNAKRTGSTDVAIELARFLHLNMAYGIEFEELSQEGHGKPAYIGQATLTRLPIRTARVLRFQRQSGFWKPRRWIPSYLPLMQRRIGGRIALVTELEFQGRLVVVYNVHLESRSAGAIQMEQFDEILSDLQRYSPETDVIVGGDFNSKYFPSAFLKKMEQRGFRSATGERVERTHVIAMALDWIFVRGPLRVNAGEVRRDFHGSDHYPVYAELSAEPRKQSK